MRWKCKWCLLCQKFMGWYNTKKYQGDFVCGDCIEDCIESRGETFKEMDKLYNKKGSGQ